VSSSWKRGVADERFVLTPTLFAWLLAVGQQRHPQCRPSLRRHQRLLAKLPLLLNAE